MRLPDFVFGRNHEHEEAEGLRLAGIIITDFTKPQLTEAEWREIQDFIDRIALAVRNDPNLREGGYWRHVPPPNGLAPPFPEDAVRDRMVGHLGLTFEIDQAGMVWITSSEVALNREQVDQTIRRGMH